MDVANREQDIVDQILSGRYVDGLKLLNAGLHLH